MNFEFEFNVEKPDNTNSTGDDNRPQVDWAARTQYMVDNCGTANKAETEIFIITGVIDLGLQMQEDGKSEFKGTEADQAAELAKNPDQYFETLLDKGVPKLYKRWKITKPQQSVALTVDNPNRLLDIAQFHNPESDGTLHPLRMLLNGEFYSKAHGKKVVNKMGYSTKEVKNADGSWSFKNNTTLFKLGKAADVLCEKGNFKPAQIGKLIGKAILCEFQVHTNTVGDKVYLNEKIGFRSEVPSFMKAAIPTIDPKYFYGVNFKGPQDLEVLKNLRQSIIITMQEATNFRGSDIEKALIEIGRVKASDEPAPQPDAPIEPKVSTPVQQKQQAPAVRAVPDFDSFDDDIPF